MPVEIFTKAEFEHVLPELAYEVGFGQGEWVYHLPIVEGEIEIEIRSSVGANNQSADTGKDSIRCWLVNGDGKPLGSKTQSYVTRVTGWETRMLGVLRLLWNLVQKSGYCSDCKIPKSIYKVKKHGINKNRYFSKCNVCKQNFSWLD